MKSVGILKELLKNTPPFEDIFFKEEGIRISCKRDQNAFKFVESPYVGIFIPNISVGPIVSKNDLLGEIRCPKLPERPIYLSEDPRSEDGPEKGKIVWVAPEGPVEYGAVLFYYYPIKEVR